MIRPRVCMIDPCRESQQLLRKVLGKYCDLNFQDDGLQLADVIEVFQPDLIILELDLPRLNGFELLYVLQEDHASRDIPAMIFSTLADVESQKQAYRLGAMNFQPKPCKPSQLFKAAALFMRLAGDEEPQRRYSMEEVECILADRAKNLEIHPMFNKVLTAHQTRDKIAHSHYGRVVRASVTSSHPRSVLK